MQKQNIINFLRNNSDKLESYGVKKIGLFGSFEKDKQNEKSDIDILVEFYGDVGWEFIDLKRFLEKKLEDCSKYDAWNKIASHVSKLDKALQTNYIRDAVSKVRDIAKSELDRTEPKVKGYNDPQSVISNVSRTDTQLVAKIQLEGGARREEALQFRNDQLKGIQQDPATGEKKGVIELENTKGGKERDIYVSQVTYKQLEERTQNNNFKISPNTYSKHIAQAAKKAGEERTGTHDLRYNWACNRYNECVANGLNNEQALQLTSWEMGHERANMTLHYLR